MSSNASKRRVSPDDPRLRQLADMRRRGLTQSEMARAMDMSQQTCSRLLSYYDDLSEHEKARLQAEQQPSSLAAMMRQEKERRALLEEIYNELHSHGKSERWAALWDMANSL